MYTSKLKQRSFSMPEEKKYKVSCDETVHAYCYVDAKSEKEALEKAEKILDDEGMPLYAKTFDREFKACRAEEL